MRVRIKSNGGIPVKSNGAGQAYGSDGEDCCCGDPSCTNATGCADGSPAVLTTCNGARVAANSLTGSASGSFSATIKLFSPFEQAPTVTLSGSVSVSGIDIYRLIQTGVEAGETLFDGVGGSFVKVTGRENYDNLPPGMSLSGSVSGSIAFVETPAGWGTVGTIRETIRATINVQRHAAGLLSWVVVLSAQRTVLHSITIEVDEGVFETSYVPANYSGTIHLRGEIEDTAATVCAGSTITLSSSTPAVDDGGISGTSFNFGEFVPIADTEHEDQSLSGSATLYFKRLTEYPSNGECDNCPRAILASGSFYYSGETPLTFSGRMLQVCPELCTHSKCEWTGTGTVTPPGGSPTTATLTLTAHDFEQNEWQMNVAWAGGSTYQLFKATTHCPTGGLTLQLPSVDVYEDEATIDYSVDQSLSLTADEPIEGDPSCYCGCADADDVYTLSIQCEPGTTPDGWIDMTLTRVAGTCSWRGTLGDFTATLAYDGTNWHAEVKESGVLHTNTIPWAGSDSDPTGTHGYDYSVLDETCSSLAIIIS